MNNNYSPTKPPSAEDFQTSSLVAALWGKKNTSGILVSKSGAALLSIEGPAMILIIKDRESLDLWVKGQNCEQ